MSTPLIDAWNTKDPDQVAALYAPDGVRHQIALPEALLEGRDAIRDMVAALMHSTPNFVLTERAHVEQGDRQVVEWNWSGTIENDLGDLPGRGQSVNLDGISSVLVRDGMIVQERVYWDTATLLAGAGLLG